MKQNNTMVPSAYIVLKKGNQILLVRRQNTGFADGKLCPPVGHVEEGESFTQAAIREAKEEVGVVIAPDDVKPFHIKCQRHSDGHSGIAVFFLVERWHGEPKNCEIDKCGEVKWADLNDLPDDLLPYIKTCVERGLKGDFFSEWE